MQPPYQQPTYYTYPPQNQQSYQQFPNHTQPKKRNYKKVATALLVIIFISVILTIEIVHGILTPSCTVGIPETTAKITMQGLEAPSDCSQLVSSGYFYAVNGPVNEPVICGAQDTFRQYTVYYEGVIDRVGRALCLTLPELMDSCITNPLDQLIAVSNDTVPTVKLENRPECLTGQD